MLVVRETRSDSVFIRFKDTSLISAHWRILTKSALSCSADITKTRLFKYMENVISKT